jgi:hypothetical protein
MSFPALPDFVGSADFGWLGFPLWEACEPIGVFARLERVGLWFFGLGCGFALQIVM